MPFPVVALATLILSATPPTHAMAIGSGQRSEPPNTVILITIDGARVDLVDRPTSAPTLNQLAAKGRSLHYATTPSPLTFPATVSVMTGLYPTHSGVKEEFTIPLGDGPETLPEAFRKAGWVTGGFPSDNLSHRKSGIEQGFERFASMSPSWNDEARVDSVMTFLSSNDGKRRFVWMGLSLLAPQEPWERFRGTEATDSTQYLSRASVADAAIGKLLQEMNRTGALKQSLVIVAGTHGESVPGFPLPDGPKSDGDLAGHGLNLAESVLRVPVVFYREGEAPGSITSSTNPPSWSSTVDLFPTIAELASIEPPKGLDGVSLVGEIEGRSGPSRVILHELDLGRTLGWVPRFGARQGRFKLLAYGPARAIQRVDGGTGQGSAAEAEASLRPVLQAAYGVNLKGVPGSDDPTFALEDRQMAELQVARLRSSARESFETLEKLVSYYPLNGPILIEKAMVEIYGRREKFAATMLDSLLKARPDYVEAEAAYAELLMRFDRSDVAITRLSHPAVSPMFECDRLWRLGAAQVAAKQYPEAGNTYLQAEEVGAPSTEQLLRFRDRRMEIRQIDAEIGSYPNLSSSWVKLGKVYGDLELYDDCYAAIQKARGFAPLEAEPEYWLGYYLMEEGRPKHAAAAFERAVQKDSTKVEYRLELADAQIMTGEIDKASTNLEKVVELGSKDPRALYNLACIKTRGGNAEAGLRYLGEAVDNGYANRDAFMTDPDLDLLRSDPRFKQILDRMPSSSR
jgi:tetratricopeptide (TPR) repeat protein